MLRRTTTSIVRGGVFKQALKRKQPETEVDDDDVRRSNAEIDTARRKLLYFILLPVLLLLLLLTLVLLLVFRPRGITPGDGQYLVAIPAENALLERIEAGDVVQLYTANGPVGSIRFVQVASVADGSCLVVLDDLQLRDYLALKESYTLVPIVCGNKAAAAKALAQQQKWNDPEIALQLSKTELLLEVGGSAELNCTVQIIPEDATRPGVRWMSSDENVATVDENGVVTASRTGSTIVTAVCGGTTASCTVRVIICADELLFDAESYEMSVGQELPLPLTILPEGTNEALTWASSDENVVTVDENGVVTAHSGGSVTITVSGQKVSASCTVNISVLAESIVLNSSEQSLIVGQSVQLAAVVMPENASDKTVIWASSDENVATVDENGMVHTKTAGAVTITASCGGISAECQITVAPAPEAPTP